MKKIKDTLYQFIRSREVRTAMLMSLTMAVMCAAAFAEDTTTPATIDTAGITTAFTSGFNSMVTNSISMISAMVPIALTLAGVTFLIRKAIGWFKSVAK